jgi:hypothetical protein
MTDNPYAPPASSVVRRLPRTRSPASFDGIRYPLTLSLQDPRPRQPGHRHGRGRPHRALHPAEAAQVPRARGDLDRQHPSSTLPRRHQGEQGHRLVRALPRHRCASAKAIGSHRPPRLALAVEGPLRDLQSRRSRRPDFSIREANPWTKVVDSPCWARSRSSACSPATSCHPRYAATRSDGSFPCHAPGEAARPVGRPLPDREDPADLDPARGAEPVPLASSCSCCWSGAGGSREEAWKERRTPDSFRSPTALVPPPRPICRP